MSGSLSSLASLLTSSEFLCLGTFFFFPLQLHSTEGSYMEPESQLIFFARFHPQKSVFFNIPNTLVTRSWVLI